MALIDRFKGYILTALVCALVFGGYLLIERSRRPAPMTIIIPTATIAPTEAPLVVDVVGAVRMPGVYTLSPGSRWRQAIEAAGGLTDDADRLRVNLADYLVDGQQVVVAEIGATPLPTLTACQEPLPAVSDHEGVNINTATAAELESLPCIGPALAERIIAYRQEHGPFGQPDDIVNVDGIGPATWKKLQDLITVE